MKRFIWIACVLLACGDDSGTTDAGADATVDGGVDGSFDSAFDSATDTDVPFDGGTDVLDSGGDDADLDASIDEGFGDIAGPCPLIGTELTSEMSAYLWTRIDFADDPFDDPEDVPQLTPGGQEILEEGTLGGSSGVSEAFAYEVLRRCEGATLIKSETEIDYMMGVPGASTDMIVDFGGTRIGVSVTRAVGFPREDPYPPAQATSLLNDKLSDVLESSARVTAEDAWEKQILVVMAYGEMHSESLQAAYFTLDPSVRADTIVYVVITDGMDGPVYGD